MSRSSSVGASAPTEETDLTTIRVHESVNYVVGLKCKLCPARTPVRRMSKPVRDGLYAVGAVGLEIAQDFSARRRIVLAVNISIGPIIGRKDGKMKQRSIVGQICVKISGIRCPYNQLLGHCPIARM